MSWRRALREALRPSGETCFGCARFVGDAAALEAAVPGLASLGSAHASVRADDGLCLRHGVHLNGRRACAERQAVADSAARAADEN